jgi:hypothetical protein
MLGGTSPRPSYWAQRMFSTRMKGKVIAAVSRQENLTVYAAQDPEKKDVNLFLVSQMDRYRQVKIRMNNRDADIMVDAGLDQLYEFEVPSYSIACLEIKADRSEGRVSLYTSKMASAAQEPRVSPVRPR